MAESGVSGTMGSELAAHVERHLAARSTEITRTWAGEIAAFRKGPPLAPLPGPLLDDVAAALRGLGRLLVDGAEPTALPPPLRAGLGRVADLRRQQGASLEEILEEFAILSRLVEAVIAEAVTTFEGTVARAEVVRVVGRAKDAILLLGSETARRFRAWTARHRHERLLLLERYSDMLSHELANRLGAAETAARLLMGRQDLDQERRQSLTQLILNAVKSGLETVHGVRALFRARDDAEPGVRLLPLDRLLGGALHQLRERAAVRGITLGMPASIPKVAVDLERFPLVFHNLAGNAIRHHDRPGGTGTVAIDVRERDGTVVVEVTDDGPGLSELVFEENSLSSAHEEGRGLGLAIAREAVEQMGGRLELEANHPRGTILRFSIPVAPDTGAG